MKELYNFYKGKKIFLTGHTGFKGAWLSQILINMGAKVVGYSLAPEEKKSLFDLLDIQRDVESNIYDIRDYDSLVKCIKNSKPDIVFHLAAQALVRDSYNAPINNYSTNVIGTVNLFEAIRKADVTRAIINVTSDKCYENKEWCWSYRENDRLGGHDPYSASKACSELVTVSYRKSFFEEMRIGLASARAGNVVGGGDFSKYRIIPDIVRAIEENERVCLRSPESIRPWQLVLDILYGYLILGKKLYDNPEGFSQAYNFGPLNNKQVTVKELSTIFIENIDNSISQIYQKDTNFHESSMLKLDPSKSIKELNWAPKYNINEVLQLTAQWYREYLNGGNMKIFTNKEIDKYSN